MGSPARAVSHRPAIHPPPRATRCQRPWTAPPLAGSHSLAFVPGFRPTYPPRSGHEPRARYPDSTRAGAGNGRQPHLKPLVLPMVGCPSGVFQDPRGSHSSEPRAIGPDSRPSGPARKPPDAPAADATPTTSFRTRAEATPCRPRPRTDCDAPDRPTVLARDSAGRRCGTRRHSPRWPASRPGAASRRLPLTAQSASGSSMLSLRKPLGRND